MSPTGLCAFGCNDEVQLVNLLTKKPVTSLYIKTPNLNDAINDINDRKVTAVLITERFIVFSTVSGFLTIFEILNNSIICKFTECILEGI